MASMASAIRVAAFRRARNPTTGLRRATQNGKRNQAPALSAAWSDPTACHHVLRSPRDDLIGGATLRAGRKAAALATGSARRHRTRGAVSVMTKGADPVRLGLPRLCPCCSASARLHAKAAAGAGAAPGQCCEQVGAAILCGWFGNGPCWSAFVSRAGHDMALMKTRPCRSRRFPFQA